MAVTIRLARHGRKKLPFYRIVVADKEKKRDGRYLERIGSFDPLKEPAYVELNEERMQYWIGVGAKPSDTVAQIIERRNPGYLSGITSARLDRIRKARSKRKERAKARA